ncbi:hypothetical protein ElyMa_006323900 [Elysia marginata]|uniref:VWFA domain-containing protein n=1 Tax=Elysia marginata TaxID=1093978 RepID=A0AAV4HHI6_9GAST|nr:hypothetical protein ElyMa_006323900 [Elysia marginata]
MLALDFLFFAGFVVLAKSQNICPPTEVLFLLDESENARQAASTDPNRRPFDLLQNSLRNFLRHPLIANSPNDFRVGAISYSSGNDQRQVIPPRSSIRQALGRLNTIGRVSHAGSWTHRGLEEIDLQPMYPNSILIVISSQGSGNQQRRNLSQQQINRVTTQLGWKPYVIVPQGVQCDRMMYDIIPQGTNPIDMAELTLVNGGRPPAVLYDRSLPPQGYRQLDRALNRVVEQMLCTMPPPPPPSPVHPPVNGYWLKAVLEICGMVGALSYSSGNDQTQVIPVGSNPTQAIAGLNNIGRVSHAGSWTYRGLERITARPRYANSMLIVISSQGSGNRERRNLAQQQINRVTSQLGWRPYVVVAQGTNTIDMAELTLINRGQPPVVLYDRSPKPQGYKQLRGVMDFVIEQILCTGPAPTTTPRPVMTTRRPTTGSKCFSNFGQLIYCS